MSLPYIPDAFWAERKVTVRIGHGVILYDEIQNYVGEAAPSCLIQCDATSTCIPLQHAGRIILCRHSLACAGD